MVLPAFVLIALVFCYLWCVVCLIDFVFTWVLLLPDCLLV